MGGFEEEDTKDKKKVSDSEDKCCELPVLLSGLWQRHSSCILKICFFQFTFIYLETAFHLMVFGEISNYILLPVLTALPVGAMLALITGLFDKKVNLVLMWSFTASFCLLFCVQLVYHDIFKAFLSFYSVGAVGTDALEFGNQILSATADNFFGILLLLLPLPVLGFLLKGIMKADRDSTYLQAAMLGSGIFGYILFLLVLPLYGKGSYSPYDLYFNTWVQEIGTEQLGMLTYARFDAEQLIFRKNNSLDDRLVLETVSSEKEPAPEAPVKERPAKNPVSGRKAVKATVTAAAATPIPIPIDTSPNVLDIDFNTLAGKESNKTVRKLHEYFASVTPTNKNKYTGLFEGYNLIMLTAEGFSPYAVDEKVTPTLYKLVHEGFVFNNFYTPLWWASTSDGEYVACTSLIPKVGVTSFYVSGSNAMPFALGTQFGKLGYGCRAYHDHTYTYYKRHISHPNMGYVYKGVGNGLKLTDCWPESDLEMMEVTIPEYIDDQPFHTYYMTVSGHMNYTFFGNSMSSKNKEAVEDLPYSQEARAYIACNVELDRALEKLIRELRDHGIADRTVIALSADHYPYGLAKEKIDELAGHEVEENFELYRNHFILWSDSIKDPIVIDKVCSSLDIMPTLSNLFGLEFDSRLFMGRDILSDAAPLVIFSNRSFINDKVMYNSVTKETVNLTGGELPEDYIRTMNQIVDNKFLISESILEEDYYRDIQDEIE